MVHKSTISDPGGPPENPKQPEMHPRSPHFPLSLLKGARMRLSHSKIALNRLCHFHLPSLYPDTLNQPSVTLGPPSGPKSNQKCTQDHHIFFCPCSKWLVLGHITVGITFLVISITPSCSKITSKMSLSFPGPKPTGNAF